MAACETYFATLKEKAELEWKVFCEMMTERGWAYFDENVELIPEGRDHPLNTPEREIFVIEMQRRMSYQ